MPDLDLAAGAPGLRVHVLPDGHRFLQGELPPRLRLDRGAFERLWAEHPDTYPRIRMGGRLVATPRWIASYGRRYVPSERDAAVRPVPAHLAPYLAWARETLDPRLNTVQVNWYDAALGHHIGPHRDYRVRLAEGAPIVTISFGEDRVFRLRPWRGRGHIDFAARDGTVFVTPYATNLSWTHEVPRLARNRGRRISVTLRAVAD